jgi:hypothetical protein
LFVCVDFNDSQRRLSWDGRTVCGGREPGVARDDGGGVSDRRGLREAEALSGPCHHADNGSVAEPGNDCAGDVAINAGPSDAAFPDVFVKWYFAMPSIHAMLGTAAEVLGIFIALVAGTKLVPKKLRFGNWKRWMRVELVLWWIVLLSGVATYYVWYVAPSG